MKTYECYLEFDDNIIFDHIDLLEIKASEIEAESEDDAKEEFILKLKSTLHALIDLLDDNGNFRLKETGYGDTKINCVEL